MEGGDIRMSSIDRRVVEMVFDNKAFEAGIKDTLGSLDALKKGLNLDGAAKGLHDISAAGRNFSLHGIASGIENISSKFSAMGAIGFAVIQNLTNAALDFGKRITAKIFDPLVGGGRRRALNIEQAKFQFRGLGMDVEATMESALQAVTGTAYGLDEAAKAAGQFGASGMRAGDDMTSALRAISGVAAMTSSSYDDIANVFTKVAGNGRVMGDDLLRLSARGLNAAATLADHLGISEREVRELVTEGQISFEMFYQAMDKAFGENATKANETYTGSLANMRAALSRIGARFFTPWLEQQRDLFNALSPAIDAVGEALKPVIDRMSQFTGNRTKGLIRFIEGLDLSRLNLVFAPLMAIARNIGEAFKSIASPIRDAFRDIFPPMTLDRLNAILKAVQKFTAGIKMGAEGAANLRRTFAGVFAVFGIGWEIVKAFGKFLFDLFGIARDGSGGFLAATANVGDFLVALLETIRTGGGLTDFFDSLLDKMRPAIEVIREVGQRLSELFGVDFNATDKMRGALNGLTDAGNRVSGVWEKISGALSFVGDIIGRTATRIGEFLRGIPSAIVDYIAGIDWAFVLSAINTGLFAAFLTILNDLGKMFEGGAGRDIFGNITSLVDAIKEPLSAATGALDQLTDTLSTMQNTLRAFTLIQIAIALGIMAISVIALSRINAADLTRALGAMAALFVELGAGLLAIQAIGGVKGLTRTAGGLTVLAIALLILVQSVKQLAKLEWEELAKGLTGLAVLLASVVLAARGLSGSSKGMISAGLGLMVLSIGIKILASAVKDLADLSWEDMAKGLVGVGTLLASLAIFTRLVQAHKTGMIQGAGLVLLAVGIKILASAVEDFAGLKWEEIAKGLVSISGILAAFAIFSKTVGRPDKLIASGAALVMVSIGMKIIASAMENFAGLSWEEIAKGLVAMGGALLILGVALSLMPSTTLISAAAILVVSGALVVLAGALKLMGGMGWEEIGKGLLTLGASLLILAVGLSAMSGTLLGAAALVVATAALTSLAPVLYLLSGLSWEAIAKGMTVLAVAFLILAGAGIILAPTVVTFLALGAAFLLFGAGIALLGVGIDLLARGFERLSRIGADLTLVLKDFLVTIIELVPLMGTKLAEAVINFVVALADASDSLMVAFTRIAQSIIESASKLIPDVLALFTTLVIGILTVIRETVPDIVETIGVLVTGILALLVEYTPKIAKAALQIMLGILKEATFYVPLIVREIIDLVVSMLEELSKGVPDFVKAATALMVAFLQEIADNLDDVTTAAVDVIIAFVESIGKQALRLANAAADALVDFLNGLATAIDTQAPRIRAAGRNIAKSIIEGVTGGLTAKDAMGKVGSAARSVADVALGAVGIRLRSRSPSKAFRDLFMTAGEGAVIGLKQSAVVAAKAADGMGKDTIEAMKKSLNHFPDLTNMDDLHPTITPVLDLSDFDKRVDYISSALSGQKVTVDVAYSQAKDAAIRYRANEAARYATSTLDSFAEPQPTISYTQNNYSPKELSSAEIYRQTKNQLSVTKGALTPNVAQDA
jgi:tape measure domain-containing protein